MLLLTTKLRRESHPRSRLQRINSVVCQQNQTMRDERSACSSLPSTCGLCLNRRQSSVDFEDTHGLHFSSNKLLLTIYGIIDWLRKRDKEILTTRAVPSFSMVRNQSSPNSHVLCSIYLRKQNSELRKNSWMARKWSTADLHRGGYAFNTGCLSRLHIDVTITYHCNLLIMTYDKGAYVLIRLILHWLFCVCKLLHGYKLGQKRQNDLIKMSFSSRSE